MRLHYYLYFVFLRSDSEFFLRGNDNRLGDLLHRTARVHAHFLDAPECFGLTQAFAVHQYALGSVNQLARLKAIFKIEHLAVQLALLVVTGQRDLNRGGTSLSRNGLTR